MSIMKNIWELLVWSDPADDAMENALIADIKRQLAAKDEVIRRQIQRIEELKKTLKAIERLAYTEQLPAKSIYSQEPNKDNKD